MLQEVRLFASISSSHIIRYNHSWVETKDCIEEVDTSEQEPNNDVSEENVKLNSPFIEFERDSIKSNKDSEITESKKNINTAKDEMVKIRLYIQMELCKETLEDYLMKRTCPLTIEEYNKSLDMAKQLIKSIDTIHSIYKIIHRDLSLRNIFI